jgi:hypothetical protein
MEVFIPSPRKHGASTPAGRQRSGYDSKADGYRATARDKWAKTG